jgi:signal transduction histidine kinase
MRYSQATPLVLVPGLLLALGLVWFGLQRIVRPLQRLEAQARELGWGNFSVIEKPVGGIDEIQHLQDTLRLMVKSIQAAQAGMHNYIGAITQAQEDERTRLARELHDQTTQSLIALNHQQQMLKPHFRDNSEATAMLAELRSMIEAIIEDLRRIVRAMRPIYLEELGLATALKMLVKDLNLGEQVAVRFEQQGTPRRLSPETELALYRVTQEALTNAWHHSEASSITLSIAFEESHVTISVSDNGKGFAAPERATDLSVTGHFGILGMYERAALIGAHLQIHSGHNKGTTVTIRVPYGDERELTLDKVNIVTE